MKCWSKSSFKANQGHFYVLLETNIPISLFWVHRLGLNLACEQVLSLRWEGKERAWRWVGPVVRALGFACGYPGFISHSNFWFGFVSGCAGFNSTTLCKLPTGCLLLVGALNHVSVKFELFLSDS